ncbi:DUF7134 domain-containing protein [Nostocoides australiense]
MRDASSPHGRRRALTAGLWSVTLVVQADTGSLGRPVWLAVASASLQVLPLVPRRRQPIIAFALVGLGCVAGLFVVDHFRFPDVGFPIALRAMSAHSRNDIMRRWALVVGALAGYVAGFSWRA